MTMRFGSVRSPMASGEKRSVIGFLPPPCQRGSEPKANGGFGLKQRNPPLAKTARFPPCQGGGEKKASSWGRDRPDVDRGGAFAKLLHVAVFRRAPEAP